MLVTGPSATADIEGVLIHGAEGVRSLTVLSFRFDAGGRLKQIDVAPDLRQCSDGYACDFGSATRPNGL